MILTDVQTENLPVVLEGVHLHLGVSLIIKVQRFANEVLNMH
jgi:hypothetical protein